MFPRGLVPMNIADNLIRISQRQSFHFVVYCLKSDEQRYSYLFGDHEIKHNTSINVTVLNIYRPESLFLIIARR